MEELHGTRRTLARALESIGFDATDGGTGALDGHVNLVRALLCAGLYPNVARIRLPDTKYTPTAMGAVESVNDDARAVKFYEVGGSRVFIHPSCVLFGESSFEHARWLCFSSKQHVGGHAPPPGAAKPPAAGGVGTGKTYVRDVSAVSPLALLLFGGDVQVHHEQGTVTIDKEISFEAPGRVAVLVRELRASLDKLLADKIQTPSLQISKHPVLEAIVNLITTERAGFS